MNPECPGFNILRSLGSGTHGDVYEALQASTGRHLALKVFRGPGSPSASEEEARLRSLLLLRHPRILSPLQAGRTSAGEHCLLMPLVRSDDPRPLVLEGGPAAVMSLLVQAAAGLACLHDAGLIHGDIKPSNVMVERREGGSPWEASTLFLSDMDSALAVFDARDRGGRVTGTVGYMAPELLEGEAPSPSADLFALGAWLYWLITGREPFVGATLEESLLKLRSCEQLAPCGRFDGRFSGRLWQELLAGMLSPDPAGRFGNGIELLRFVARHSPDVPGAAREMPRLAWNGLALLPEEECAAAALSAALMSSEQPAGRVFVIQTRRHTAAREAAQRALIQAGCGPWPLVLRPEDSSQGRLDRLLEAEWTGAILDDSAPDGRFPTGELEDLLRLCVLAGQKAAGPAPPIVLLQPVGASFPGVTPGSSLKNLCHIQNIAPPPPFSKDERAWAARLFSGIPLDGALSERLERSGYGTGSRLASAMALALRRGVLEVADGSIQLDPEETAGFAADLERLDDVAGASCSEEASALLDVLRHLPLGLTTGLRNRARDSIPGYADAERELLSLGEITVEASTGCLVAMRGGAAIRSTLSEEARETRRRMVRALCEGVVPEGRRAARTPRELALQLLEDPPSPAVLRRAAAHLRRAIEANRLEDARAMAESGPDPRSDLGVDSAVARWLEARAQVWDACEEHERSARDRRNALEIYRHVGTPLLAARVAGKLALSWAMRTRAEESMALLNEAEALVSRVDGGSAARMRTRLKALTAFLQRWCGNDKEAVQLAFGVVSGSVDDAIAVAHAQRVLAVDASRRGDAKNSRLWFSAAIRHARRSGSREVLAICLTAVANFEFARGHYARAGRMMRRVLRYPPGTVRPMDRLVAFGVLGGMAYEAGRVREALGVNLRGYASSRREDGSLLKGQAAHNVSHILHDMNRLAESLSMLQIAVETRVWMSSAQGSNPRITMTEVLCEVGDLSGARAGIRTFLSDQGVAETLTMQANASRALSHLALLEGSASDALRHARDARAKFETAQAVDEILKTDYVILECERPALRPDEVLARLAGLEARARDLKNWRLETRFRLSRLTWDESADPDARLAELDDLLRGCFDRGYAILELPMLELKARLLMKLGRLMAAQDVLREALARIKAVASAFTDTRLRDIYLADPRRQRFLDLIRASREGRPVQG